ncbi:MAG: hypothetical protein V1857_06245 [archaeon]
MRELLVRSALAGEPIIIPIQWARQSGKTEVLVHTVIALCIYFTCYLQQRYRIAFMAPSVEEQSIIVTRGRVQEAVLVLKPWLKPIYGVDIILGTGRRTADFIFRSSAGIEATIRCVSAGTRANVKAHTFDLMLFEQPEDMDPDKLANDILPFGAGSELGCLIIMAGSAAPTIRNTFYLTQIEEQEKKTGVRPPWFVDGRLAAMYRPGYAKYLDQMRNVIGAQSDAFITQYDNLRLRPANRPFDTATMRQILYDPTMVDFSADIFRAVGIDVAKSADSTVATGGILHGLDPYLLEWKEMQGINYHTQAVDLCDFIKQGQYTLAKIDNNGPGAALADELEYQLGKNSVPCTVDRQPLTAQENNRIYTQYEQSIINTRFHYPDIESTDRRRFEAQHLGVLRHYSAEKFLKLVAPTNQHEDFVVSSALLVDALLNSTGMNLPSLTRSR